MKALFDLAKSWFLFVFETVANYVPFVALAWNWITGERTRAFGLGIAALKALVAIAGLAWVVLGLFGSLADVEAGLDSLTAATESVTASLQTLPVDDYLRKANVLLPISEALGLLSIYVAARVVALGIRIIRSFLPTVGG